MKHEFTCSKCGQTKIHDSDFTTGYGVNDKGEKTCYACCGLEDAKYLADNGKLQGYYVKGEDQKWYFTNWPGTLKLPVYYHKTSWHNFAGEDGRTDFWLKYNGNEYHGVQIGHNSQIATIKKIKTTK